MRILHITPSYKPAWCYGGPTVSVSQLAEWQVKAGHTVNILTTTANGSENLPDVPGGLVLDGTLVYRFKRLTGDHTHFSPGLLWFLIRNAKKFDAIHLHSWWNLVALFSALILRLLNIRFVLSPRGMFSNYTVRNSFRTWFQLTFSRFLLGRAIFHATSSMEEKEIRQIFPTSKIFILPNYIPLPKHPVRKIHDDTFRFLFYSRIHDKKGLELTFHCLSELLDLPWVFRIAGNGDSQYIDQLKALADFLQISQRIEWCGFVRETEAQDLFSRSDLFILLSKNENFGNAVIESLAFGVPVLISEEVGASDLIGQYSWGTIVTLRQDDIMEKLRYLMQNTDITGKGPKNIAEEVRHLFSNSGLAEKYVNNYLLNENH